MAACCLAHFSARSSSTARAAAPQQKVPSAGWPRNAFRLTSRYDWDAMKRDIRPILHRCPQCRLSE